MKRITYLARTGRSAVTDPRPPRNRKERKAEKIGAANWRRAWAARRAAEAIRHEEFLASVRRTWPKADGVGA